MAQPVRFSVVLAVLCAVGVFAAAAAAGVTVAEVAAAAGSGPGGLAASGSTTGPGRAAEQRGCAPGSDTERRGDLLLCAHDDERPPPGVSSRSKPDLSVLRGRRLARPVTSGTSATVAGGVTGDVGAAPEYKIACIGDGADGPRVQAVYAVATDQPDRSAASVPLIRAWANDVDLRIDRSAGAQGQGRRVRYVTAPTATGCELDVRVVRVAPAADDTFAAMRQALAQQGMNRTDRKYLIWADAAVGICGLGQVAYDDRPGQDNANNKGPMYARTDAPCWGHAEAHELMHMLGAVQTSAPNATRNNHCTDENDALCYEDDSGQPLRSVCPSDPQLYIDCNLDDYFAVAPPAGSYLATHWNVADSAFLERDVAPPAPPRVTVLAPATMFAGGQVTARAQVEVPAGRTYSVTWRASRSDCVVTSSASPATTAVLSCPATAAGQVQVSASITDTSGFAASNAATVSMLVPAAPRGTAMSAVASPASVVYGGALRLTGRLTDSATGAGVFGMPVTAYSTTPTGSFRTVGSGVTARDGSVAITLRPTQSGTLTLSASSTSTWAPARSPGRSVTVPWTVSAAASTARATVGQSVRVTATVRPAAAGTAVRLVQVTAAGRRMVASGVTGSTGTVALTWRAPARGTFRLLAEVPASAGRAAGTAATSVTVA